MNQPDLFDMTKTTKKNPAAVALGRSGGKAGTGASKRRSPEHYQRLKNAKQQLASARRRANDMAERYQRSYCVLNRGTKAKPDYLVKTHTTQPMDQVIYLASAQTALIK